MPTAHFDAQDTSDLAFGIALNYIHTQVHMRSDHQTHRHTSTQTHKHTDTHAQGTHAHMLTGTQEHKHTGTQTQGCTHKCIHTHMHPSTHTHTAIHTNTNRNAHTHTHSHALVSEEMFSAALRPSSAATPHGRSRCPMHMCVPIYCNIHVYVCIYVHMYIC